MYIYNKLKDLREDHDFSQQYIADYLGIDRKTYNRAEKGIHEIDLHDFISLAKLYNVSLDYLAGLTDIPRKLYDEK